MSTSSSSSSSSGIGFFGLLAILFIALKLTDVIAWSWWWVTSPLWAPAILTLSVLAIFLCYKIYSGKKKEKAFRERIASRINRVEEPKRSSFSDRLDAALKEQKKAMNKIDRQD